MFQGQPPQTQNNMSMVYWSLAFDPVLLALIALFLKAQGVVGQLRGSDIERYLLLPFLIIALAAAWFSFRLLAQEDSRTVRPGNMPQYGKARKLMLALSLAIVPGILGFVLYLLFGNINYLIAFNGGATALAVKHILKFNQKNTSLS